VNGLAAAGFAGAGFSACARAAAAITAAKVIASIRPRREVTMPVFKVAGGGIQPKKRIFLTAPSAAGGTERT
jgi:hypothetical protein